jgi:hypothetical protein
VLCALNRAAVHIEDVIENGGFGTAVVLKGVEGGFSRFVEGYDSSSNYSLVRQRR